MGGEDLERVMPDTGGGGFRHKRVQINREAQKEVGHEETGRSVGGSGIHG